MLVSAALFGDAAIRDVAARMDPLLYTTRLRKAEYLGGRFLAALAINAIVVLAIPLGFWVATVTLVEADALGPNHFAAYVQPLLFFMLPNIILVGAIQFTIGTLATQVIPVYLGTASLFIGYLVAANYWSDIESPWLSALADPIGINALLAMTRYWTPAELETRLIGFPTMLVWNRVLWLAIAAGMLVALHRRFQFAHTNGRARTFGRVRADRRARRPKVRWQGTMPRISGVFVACDSHAADALHRASVAGGGDVGPRFSGGVRRCHGPRAAVGLERGRHPLRNLHVAGHASRGRGGSLQAGPLHSLAGHRPLCGRTGVEASRGRDRRDRRCHAGADRHRARSAASWRSSPSSQAFQTALLIGGVLLQALQGYYNFELGLYVRVLFGLNLVDHVLLAALAMTVHVLVNQKYVGHILVLMASAFRIGGPMSGVHRMLVYNSDPGWMYSDMNGFGPFLEPFFWFKAYWSAWALLFAVDRDLFWVRGTELGVRHRLALARARFAARRRGWPASRSRSFSCSAASSSTTSTS